MPAINNADKSIKLKVFNECNESHDEFHDHAEAAVRKLSKTIKFKDHRSSSVSIFELLSKYLRAFH